MPKSLPIEIYHNKLAALRIENPVLPKKAPRVHKKRAMVTPEELERLRVRSRINYLENREEILARGRAKYAAKIKQRIIPTNKLLLKGARYRAKQLGLPFNLTLEDIVVPEVCPILGTPLIQGVRDMPYENCPTVDRLVPELGYVRGNIAIISRRANVLKNNATKQEILLLAKWAETVL